MTTQTKTDPGKDKDQTKDPGEKDTKAQGSGKARKTASKTTAPIATVPEGKGTQKDKPSPSNPPALPRSDLDQKDPGVKKDKEDIVRKQSDKARWEFGDRPGQDDTATLLAEQREIDAKAREGK